MSRYERGYTGQRRTSPLRVHLTPSEHDELTQAAAGEGAASLSTFARELMLKRSAARPISHADLKAELRAALRLLKEAQHALNAVGNLLNQLARHANTTGQLNNEQLADLSDAIRLTKQTIELYVTALQRVISL